MAGSTDVTRVVALALVALALAGCVTGHLFDRARRREYLGSVREAWIDGDRLVIGFEATVTDDDGHELGRVPRWAAVPLRDLAATTVPPVEQLSARPRGGRPVTVWDGVGVAPAPPFLRVVDGETAAPLRLVVETPDSRTIAGEALTVVRTAPWAYPLMPLTLVVDALVTLPLAVMAPAVLVFGD
jgi:hypothetical protein